MRQGFRNDEFLNFLEAELGFAIAAFERLPGRSSSLNFKAVRMSDGFPFVVKCLPRDCPERVERWRANLKALEGSKSVGLLFPETCLEYGDCRILFLSFGEGVRKAPEKLTGEDLARLREDYEGLSRAMQRCADPYPPLDGLQWFGKCFSRQGGWRRRLVGRIVRWRLAGRTSFDRKSTVVVIHGDLHAGNMSFVHGRLSAVFDVEDLRLGYPTEDWVRFFSCAYEHISPLRVLARRRLLNRFVAFVKESGYSVEQWRTAIDLYLMLKISGFGLSDLGVWGVLKIILKTRTYVNLRKLAREALHA